MAKNERLRRDMAGVGPEPRRTGLRPLSGLADFRISKGEPDIRGWSVRTLNGREIGKVDDLLVDADAGEVVMMDVEMRASERHLQLPLRHAQLDHSAHRVIVDSGDVDTYSAIDDMPAHDRDRDRYYDSRERAREREESLARDARRDDLSADVRTPALDADAAERRQLAPDTRADAEEVVVERRPVIEEVVIRRRVVDTD